MDKGSYAYRTQSGLSYLKTADGGDDMSETRGTIWKQLVKQKEEDGLSGYERLSRNVIKAIRNKIRRERTRSKKKSMKGLTRKMTSMEMVKNNVLTASMNLVKLMKGMNPITTN